MSRAAIGHLLNTTVTVRRRQVSDDGVGGQRVEWATVGNLPARISQPVGSANALVFTADQTRERLAYLVYVAPDADVRRGDLLDDGAGVLWVEAVSEPSVAIYRRADSREYQADAGEVPHP